MLLAPREALTTRAVGLLGFVGVILALLLQGSGLKGIDPSQWTWAFLVASVFALLISAIFALQTISPKVTAMPKVHQLREWWGAYSAEPYPGTASPQIAESLLNSMRIDDESAISAALEHANSCAKSFSWSVRSMLLALIFLSLLLINILLISWSG